MKYFLIFVICLLLSGCFSQLVKYERPENNKYGEISFLEPEPTELRPQPPVVITYIHSLSFLNRGEYLSEPESGLFLRSGQYRAIVFCNRDLMPDGTRRKKYQGFITHGPFEHVTLRIEQSQSYVLDCHLVNEGQRSVFTITNSKTGDTRELKITYQD